MKRSIPAAAILWLFLAPGAGAANCFDNPTPVPAVEPAIANRLTGVASGKGCQVASGRDGILRLSTNGVDWSAVRLPGDFFIRGVAFGGDRFVAVGGSYLRRVPQILVSHDGRNWEAMESPMRGVLHGIAFGHGRFVAVGSDGLLLTSGSGRWWRSRRSGTVATLATIAYGDDAFVVGGDDGLILRSSDGIGWTADRTQEAAVISAINSCPH